MSWVVIRVKGMSIKAYTDQVRLDRARNLLGTTSRRVQDISSDLGFTYPQSFIAFFKGATGMTPGEFRQREQMNRLAAGQAEQAGESGPEGK